MSVLTLKRKYIQGIDSVIRNKGLNFLESFFETETKMVTVTKPRKAFLEYVSWPSIKIKNNTRKFSSCFEVRLQLWGFLHAAYIRERPGPGQPLRAATNLTGWDKDQAPFADQPQARPTQL